MLAFDQLNNFLYELITKDENKMFDVYAVAVSYSHDNKQYHLSDEVFEIDPCNQTICWFNDWWEGEPYINLIGILNITVAFNEGDYHVNVKEFIDNG